MPEGTDYSNELVETWGDYIDWEKRRLGENGFLIRTLKKFNCRKIFDACLGEGCDSIYLIKNGFNVTSNELSRAFAEKALENAKKHKVKLKLSMHDWKKLSKNFPKNSFDAVLCTGNSLTHLFSEKEQLKAIENFYYLLKKSGILLIDERNYQYFLDN